MSLGGAWRAWRHAAWNECSLQREVGAEYIAQHFFYYTCETPTGSLAFHLAHFPYIHIVPVVALAPPCSLLLHLLVHFAFLHDCLCCHLRHHSQRLSCPPSWHVLSSLLAVMADVATRGRENVSYQFHSSLKIGFSLFQGGKYEYDSYRLVHAREILWQSCGDLTST